MDTIQRSLATLCVVLGACSDSSSGSDDSASSPAAANFGAFGHVYRKAHYRDDGTTRLDDSPVAHVTLPIELDHESPLAGSLSYALGGDAVRGRHYEIVAGDESPLKVQAGASSAKIRIALDPLGVSGQRWFREKLCEVMLSGANDLVLREPLAFHLWIRATAPIPRLSFPVPSATAGPSANPHVVLIEQLGASDEVATVHYILGGSAVPGVDYVILPGSESGEVQIPPGAAHGQIEIEIAAAAAGSGRTIEIALDHEASDRSEENLWTFTHTWDLENDDPVYAGEPSDHVSGGGDLINAAPDRERGIDIVRQAAAVPKTAPDGHQLQGIVQSPFMVRDNWYIRESFENQFFCGGPEKLLALPPYSRVSVYVETFAAPDDWRNSSFVKLNLRNRRKDLNHAVVFRRGVTADEVRQDWRGNDSWGEPVETSTGYWGLWRTLALESESWGRDFGVDAELIDGEVRTRLWHTHHATGETVFNNAAGDWVTEDLGDDVINPIHRFTYFTKTDDSWDLTGGDVANREKGLLAYWPMLEVSHDEPLFEPPGRFREKRRSFWEPRGNVTRDVERATVFELTIE